MQPKSQLINVLSNRELSKFPLDETEFRGYFLSCHVTSHSYDKFTEELDKAFSALLYFDDKKYEDPEEQENIRAQIVFLALSYATDQQAEFFIQYLKSKNQLFKRFKKKEYSIKQFRFKNKLNILRLFLDQLKLDSLDRGKLLSIWDENNDLVNSRFCPQKICFLHVYLSRMLFSSHGNFNTLIQLIKKENESTIYNSLLFLLEETLPAIEDNFKLEHYQKFIENFEKLSEFLYQLQKKFKSEDIYPFPANQSELPIRVVLYYFKQKPNANYHTILKTIAAHESINTGGTQERLSTWIDSIMFKVLAKPYDITFFGLYSGESVRLLWLTLYSYLDRLCEINPDNFATMLLNVTICGNAGPFATSIFQFCYDRLELLEQCDRIYDAYLSHIQNEPALSAWYTEKKAEILAAPEEIGLELSSSQALTKENYQKLLDTYKSCALKIEFLKNFFEEETQTFSSIDKFLIYGYILVLACFRSSSSKPIDKALNELQDCYEPWYQDNYTAKQLEIKTLICAFANSKNNEKPEILDAIHFRTSSNPEEFLIYKIDEKYSVECFHRRPSLLGYWIEKLSHAQKIKLLNNFILDNQFIFVELLNSLPLHPREGGVLAEVWKACYQFLPQILLICMNCNNKINIMAFYIDAIVFADPDNAAYILENFSEDINNLSINKTSSNTNPKIELKGKYQQQYCKKLEANVPEAGSQLTKKLYQDFLDEFESHKKQVNLLEKISQKLGATSQYPTNYIALHVWLLRVKIYTRNNDYIEHVLNVIACRTFEKPQCNLYDISPIQHPSETEKIIIKVICLGDANRFIKTFISYFNHCNTCDYIDNWISAFEQLHTAGEIKFSNFILELDDYRIKNLLRLLPITQSGLLFFEKIHRITNRRHIEEIEYIDSWINNSKYTIENNPEYCNLFLEKMIEYSKAKKTYKGDVLTGKIMDYFCANQDEVAYYQKSTIKTLPELYKWLDDRNRSLTNALISNIPLSGNEVKPDHYLYAKKTFDFNKKIAEFINQFSNCDDSQYLYKEEEFKIWFMKIMFENHSIFGPEKILSTMFPLDEFSVNDKVAFIFTCMNQFGEDGHLWFSPTIVDLFFDPGLSDRYVSEIKEVNAVLIHCTAQFQNCYQDLKKAMLKYCFDPSRETYYSSIEIFKKNQSKVEKINQIFPEIIKNSDYPTYEKKLDYWIMKSIFKDRPQQTSTNIFNVIFENECTSAKIDHLVSLLETSSDQERVWLFPIAIKLFFQIHELKERQPYVVKIKKYGFIDFCQNKLSNLIKIIKDQVKEFANKPSYQNYLSIKLLIKIQEPEIRQFEEILKSPAYYLPESEIDLQYWLLFASHKINPALKTEDLLSVIFGDDTSEQRKQKSAFVSYVLSKATEDQKKWFKPCLIKLADKDSYPLFSDELDLLKNNQELLEYLWSEASVKQKFSMLYGFAINDFGLFKKLADWLSEDFNNQCLDESYSWLHLLSKNHSDALRYWLSKLASNDSLTVNTMMRFLQKCSKQENHNDIKDNFIKIISEFSSENLNNCVLLQRYILLCLSNFSGGKENITEYFIISTDLTIKLCEIIFKPARYNLAEYGLTESVILAQGKTKPFPSTLAILISYMPEKNRKALATKLYINMTPKDIKALEFRLLILSQIESVIYYLDSKNFVDSVSTSKKLVLLELIDIVRKSSLLTPDDLINKIKQFQNEKSKYSLDCDTTNKSVLEQCSGKYAWCALWSSTSRKLSSLGVDYQALVKLSMK